ncbi:hypothetical protein BKA70DRAFT_1223158 [Coprinopsis sp. MPI-PUGE-AT-0042]|nr:hypothetical protein BKA70DRAFT_1223158 [Coprinopsis sp. MPI-PUGE-AT-0042]
MPSSMRKRSRPDEDSDDESAHHFPAELLALVKDIEWDSPTKAQRRGVAPRRRPNQPPPTRPVTAVNVRDNPTDDLFNADLTEASPTPCGTTDTSAFNHYVDAVNPYAAGFYHLECSLFVVQGWNSLRCQSTDFRYHLEYLLIEGNIETACSCPDGISVMVEKCYHRQFFEGYEVEGFLDGVEYQEPSSAILFSRQFLSDEAGYQTLFSVKSLSTASLKGRAIVSHRGFSSAGGAWKCSRSSCSLTCTHIRFSKERYRQMMEEGAEGGDVVDPLEDVQAVENLVRTGASAISHRPILPPLWAELPHDPQIYDCPLLFKEPPNLPFPLDEHSLCPCPAGRDFWDPSRRSIVQPCRVYTEYNVYQHSVEVQSCRQCPSSRRHHLGPDLREYSLFNYNNSTIVSHQLLDEYTSAYTLSKTPFNAWVTHISRRYQSAGQVFMGEDLFRSCWFAYVSLQAFDNDMSCTQCREFPKTVIFNGITLAYSCKHLRDSLRPPTLVSDRSIERPNVKYFPKQQLLPDTFLRRQIRSATKGPDLPSAVEEEDDEINPPPEASAAERFRKQKVERLNQYFACLDAVHEGLGHHCDVLANLFLEYFGINAYMAKRGVPRPIISFFLQIAAEESVLQLVNRSSLRDLSKFLSSLSKANASQVLSIPAVYRLIQIHPSLNTILPILTWLQLRSQETFEALAVNSQVPSPVVPRIDIEMPATGDWRDTSCLYSMPKIRDCPRYPKLRTDQQRDKSNKRGDRCGKYYALYGEQRLTGGIMVAWCTHSICYGFHCIASSEGRDDVFSAILTHWPEAPEWIVYDFACALGPYSLLREPEFFGNTFFAVDHFHSAGHTKCSHAAFLSEYANVDPRLVPINSSAAECGNGGLNRIRKSVSYMSQLRAIIYTKTFLLVWNCIRLRKMA